MGVDVSIRDAAMAPDSGCDDPFSRDFSDPRGLGRGPGFSLSPMASHPQRHRPLIGPGWRVKAHVHPNWFFPVCNIACAATHSRPSCPPSSLRTSTPHFRRRFRYHFTRDRITNKQSNTTQLESHKRHDRHHDARLCCVEGGPPEYIDLAMEPPSASRSVSRDLRISAFATQNSFV